MNTILKVLIILFVGVLVAGSFYLAVENTNLFSNIEGNSMQEGKGQRSEGASSGRGERNGGEHHDEGISLSEGLPQMGRSLAKISGITLIVLAIQFIFNRLKKLKAPKTLAV